MTAQEIIAILQDASRAIYMTESWAIRKDKLFQLVETRERVNDAIVALQKQSKPKMSEGLEEEIDRVVEIFNQDYVEDGKGIQYGELNIFSDLRDIARHFYELGRQSKGAEWTEKDIENGSYISAFLQANCGDNVTLKEATLWFMSRLKQLPIQQNKPEVNDEFEEEFIRYIYEKDAEVSERGELTYTQEDLEDIARHFAEWQRMKDYDRYAHVSLKDIHDAWHKLRETNSDIEKHPAVCFVRGADWQKEQMMKEAVEGEVTDTCGISSIWIKTKQFKQGDKVKLIIIKED